MGIFSDVEEIKNPIIRKCETTHTKKLGSGYKCFTPPNSDVVFAVKQTKICNPKNYWKFRGWTLFFWMFVWASLIRWLLFGLFIDVFFTLPSIVGNIIWVASLPFGYYIANWSHCKRYPREYAKEVAKIQLDDKYVYTSDSVVKAYRKQD